MKTKSIKKLSLDIQTVRPLDGAALDNIVGGVRQGIISTDTPSNCFKCHHRRPHRPRHPKPWW